MDDVKLCRTALAGYHLMPRMDQSKKPFCVEFFDAISSSTGRDATRTGSGRNFYPMHLCLENVIVAAVHWCFRSGRVSAYEPNYPSEAGDGAACLLRIITGRYDIVSADLVLTHGAGDALQIVATALRNVGHRRVTLPIGNFYGYENAFASAGFDHAGYYRHMNVTKPPGHGPKVVVINTPDAIAGSNITLHDLAGLEAAIGPEPVFRIFDFPYLSQDVMEDGVTLRFLQAVLQIEPSDDRCFIFTASKDMSVPGLRAGLVFSKSSVLTQAMNSVVRDRYDHASAPSTIAMLVYLACIAVYRQVAVDRQTLSESAQLVIHTLDGLGIVIPGLNEQLFETILRNITAMKDRYSRNIGVLRSRHSETFDTSCLDLWSGGYSVFPCVTNIRNDVDLTRRNMLRMSKEHNISSYCSYMFTGTPKAWRILDRQALRFRVNLSMAPNMFDPSMQRFEAALRNVWTSAS